MRSAYNQQRRKRRREAMVESRRRARHTGAEDIHPWDRLKQKVKWGTVDHRPNKTNGPGKSKERK